MNGYKHENGLNLEVYDVAHYSTFPFWSDEYLCLIYCFATTKSSIEKLNIE